MKAKHFSCMSPPNRCRAIEWQCTAHRKKKRLSSRKVHKTIQTINSHESWHSDYKAVQFILCSKSFSCTSQFSISPGPSFYLNYSLEKRSQITMHLRFSSPSLPLMRNKWQAPAHYTIHNTFSIELWNRHRFGVICIEVVAIDFFGYSWHGIPLSFRMAWIGFFP